MSQRNHGIFPLVAGLVLCALLVPAHAEPTLESLNGNGPYDVASYTDFPEVEAFSEGAIYYPENAEAPMGGVAISPGFTESQAHMRWWGPRLASHGYAVLTLSTNQPRDNPELRAEALMAAVGILRDEHARAGSPLEGRIDVDRMAVMGHSMGGGGALIAANDHGEALSAAIPFTPWQRSPDFSNISIPTLIIAGEADRIASSAEHAWPHYEMIPETTPKAYLEFADGNHFIGNSPQRTRSNLDVHDVMGRYAIAWLKLHMDGDEAYRPLIYGEVPEADQAKLSRLVTNSTE